MIINKENGELTIDGFVLGRNTTTEDVMTLGEDKVHVVKLRTGITSARFMTPIISNGVQMKVKVIFPAKGLINKIELLPELVLDSDRERLSKGLVEQAKWMVDSARKWLAGVMDCEPTDDSTDGISYEFDWGYIIAQYYEDPHYGLNGGETKIIFE